MANLKTGLLVLSSILAISKIVAAEYQGRDFYTELKENDVFGQAQRILKEIETILESEKTVEDIRNVADRIMMSTKHKLNQLHGKFLDQLADIKTEIKSDYEFLASCVLSGNEGRLENLHGQYLDDVEECIYAKVEQAADARKETVQKSQDMFQYIMKAFDGIDECGTGLSRVFCVPSVVGEIFFEIANVPTTISKMMTETNKVLISAKEAIEVCPQRKLTDMESEGQSILSNIESCIREGLKKDKKYL